MYLCIVCVTYLAYKHILSLEMSTEHFWRFAWYRFDFYANLLTFACKFNLFMIRFNGSDDANIDKL